MPNGLTVQYSIAIEPREIEEHFGARFAEPMRPRYNAAPSQRLPVILNANPQSIKPLWLVKRDGLINVRAETLREKRTFQKDLADRRCLIPADGFYEWLRHEAACVIVRRVSPDRTCHPIGSTLRGMAGRKRIV